ncbi:hypothetical protein [Caldivirga sp.]
MPNCLELLELARSSDAEGIVKLLREGCDPNVRDSGGLTPLHEAAGGGLR